MLTRLEVKNFKKLGDVQIELGQSVVLIGPNNSGKTTALQALALWKIGVSRWNEKRAGKASPEKRPGVTINRRDLISIPIPDANLLWRDLHVRNVTREKDTSKTKTQNIRIDMTVEGVSEGRSWSCGLEFDYANEESFYCRPLRLSEDPKPSGMPVPSEAGSVNIAFLPPMSGLAATEPKLEKGRIDVLLGEGQTAQVLRNLCFQIYEREGCHATWKELVSRIQDLFGVTIRPPRYVKERGEITMSYRDLGGIDLDLSASGRGLQQTLLLLAHLYANPGTVLLLDEPDAHLEVLRQRQTYQLITEVAKAQGSQIVAASHSEVVLNEAADRDVVVAFVGRPHRIDDRGSQILKSLKDIGFDHYYLAEQNGWVLYLEGSTDLAILQAFAEVLGHQDAIEALKRPFVHYVGNQPQEAQRHFHGIREAKTDLVGIALFDRLDREPLPQQGPEIHQWRRREIENYFCIETVLLAYAEQGEAGDLFLQAEAAERVQAMRKAIATVTDGLKALDKPNPWGPDIKATDEFLDPLFKRYFETLRIENMLRKSDYHVLARLMQPDELDSEVSEKLDAIVSIARQAHPRRD